MEPPVKHRKFGSKTSSPTHAQIHLPPRSNYCFNIHYPCTILPIYMPIHTCIPSGCCSWPPDTAPGSPNGFKDAPVRGLGRGTLCPARPRGGVMPIESNGCRYPSAAIFKVSAQLVSGRQYLFLRLVVLERSWEGSVVTSIILAGPQCK